MNISFLLLWIIILVFLVFFIILAVVNIKQIHETTNEPYKFPENNETYCYPNRNINLLPSITSNLCCVVAGQKTTRRPFQNISVLNDTPIVLDVAPKNFVNACEALCTNYDILQRVCNSSEALNPKYYNCLRELKPTGLCNQPALPVAQLNQQAYYVSDASQLGCEDTTACD